MHSIPFCVLFKVLASIMKEYMLVFFQFYKYLCPPGSEDTERSEARHFLQRAHESGR